ncbi:rhomboid family intramembrane serine protease [Rubripirellula amarantea]|uniref:Rhomboid family protein n=1 Tax=Rubripirellula amarantea TaxID=2527999 RepID=A0A5C5WHK6_9BACT|nr:rhomboid family intramembrane serine protease [Rubripirellula amarantea]MDA8743949.1 rhomboid family intramembrane serine protease [Rubripirellula amarantea]TWT50268.1 Rhomboid family protein [Rubripirellula amarantea]
MIPLQDSIPSRRTPFVNYAVIAICSVAFLFQLSDPTGSIAEQYGMVPVRLSNEDAPTVIQQEVIVQTNRGLERQIATKTIAPSAVAPWLTVLTCMFLHGGWMHFLGNMWFLYIFGDNVEDRLGHIGYAVVYLATGIAAGLTHFYTNMNSVVPTIGASGAIAGVMGAYAWLYPHAKVKAILPIPILIQVFVLPAPVFLGIWFVLQTYNGISASASGQAGGVAWWAHIGGFVAGAGAALLIGRAHLGNEDVGTRRF